MPPDAAIPGRNKVAATAAAIQPIRMGNLSATTTAANTRQNRPTTARARPGDAPAPIPVAMTAPLARRHCPDPGQLMSLHDLNF